MDNNQYQALEAQLTTIMRLLAAPLIRDKSIAESAPTLAKLGMGNNEIAVICNTTPNVVRTALLRAKKGRKNQ